LKTCTVSKQMMDTGHQMPVAFHNIVFRAMCIRKPSGICCYFGCEVLQSACLSACMYVYICVSVTCILSTCISQEPHVQTSRHFVCCYLWPSSYEDIIRMMHGSEWTSKLWWTRGWKCRTRAQPECDIFNRGSSYFNVARTTVLQNCISSSETVAKCEWVSSVI